MNKVFLLLLCAAVLVSAGCVKKEAHAPTVRARVIPVQSVTVLMEQTSSGDAVGGAIAGALIGSAFGLPTTGAVVGAVSESGKQSRLKGVGCQFSILIDGTSYYFSGTNIGDGSDQDIQTCSLLSSGDMLSVQEYVTGSCSSNYANHYGAESGKYSWHNYCLRKAI